LIRRSCPNIRKPARREEYRLFRLDVPGSTYTCNVGAGSRELRLKLQIILSVVGNAVVSSSGIARREEDAFTAGTKLTEELADLFCVGDGNFLLVLTVGDGD